MKDKFEYSYESLLHERLITSREKKKIVKNYDESLSLIRSVYELFQNSWTGHMNLIGVERADHSFEVTLIEIIKSKLTGKIHNISLCTDLLNH